MIIPRAAHDNPEIRCQQLPLATIAVPWGSWPGSPSKFDKCTQTSRRPDVREAPAAARREALVATGREAPVVTSDYYTSIPLLDKHAMTRQAFRY